MVELGVAGAKKEDDGQERQHPQAKVHAQGSGEAMVIVSADATAAHQAVINVLDAARRAGLPRLTFATQTGN